MDSLAPFPVDIDICSINARLSPYYATKAYRYGPGLRTHQAFHYSFNDLMQILLLYSSTE